MKKCVKGSMTVEAALLYPYMILITILLIKLTVYQYAVVKKQAAELYAAVFTEPVAEISELVRAADTAFDLFEK